MTHDPFALFREIHTDGDRAVFRKPTRLRSLIVLIVGTACLVMAAGVFLYDKTPSGAVGWGVTGCMSLVSGSIGVVAVSYGIGILFLRESLIVDLKALAVIHDPHALGKRSRRVFPFKTLCGVVVRQGEESDEGGRCASTVTLENEGGESFLLGTGGHDRATAFGRRLSDLTGLPIRVIEARAAG